MHKPQSLIIENLSFKFANNRPHFFEHLSVIFEPGQLNFISGENGAGKSTLFRLIKNDIQHQEIMTGTITLDNRPAHTLVHMVDQDVDTMLAPEFTVQENLQLAALARLPGLHRLPREKKFKLLTNFFSHQLPHTQVKLLSGGQRQILAILMSMQKKCRVLLLDEPTASLDRTNAHMVMTCLQEIAKSLDIVVLIISHDQELTHQFAFQRFYLYINDQGKRTIQ